MCMARKGFFEPQGQTQQTDDFILKQKGFDTESVIKSIESLDG